MLPPTNRIKARLDALGIGTGDRSPMANAADAEDVTPVIADQPTLGSVLRELRGNRNRKAVAAEAKMSAETLKAWEADKVTTITEDDAFSRLAAVLGTTPRAINARLRGEPVPSVETHEPTPIERAFLTEALKGLRGPRRTFLQEAIQVAANEATSSR